VDVKRSRAPNIRAVAASLGVSASTVSRALTRPDLLNERTRKRVLEGIERLGFRPNLIARDLSRGETRIVLVVVPSLSNFFMEIFRGGERAAAELGYTLLLGHSQGDAEREQAFFDQVASRRADGIILLTGTLPSQMRSPNVPLPPLVLAAEYMRDFKAPTVRIDHAGGAEEAVRHLIHLGHKRIAHIAGPDHVATATDRLNGYRKALRAAKIPVDESLIQRGNFTIASGHNMMQVLMTQKRAPTAVFAANDDMAVGAMRAVKRLGLRVPEDISVIGFDDQEIAEFQDPPLTTVHIPRFDIGYRSMLMLETQIRSAGPAETITVPTRLVIRSSSTAPARA